MASRRISSEPARARRKPPTTLESREQQMAGLAFDLAEKQLRDGSASSQVITHYLKAGSSRELLEQERLRHENELTKVKIESVADAKRIEEMYADAIGAMRSYQGVNASDDEEEDAA